MKFTDSKEYIREIKLLMEYATPEAERAAAVDLVEKYTSDLIALRIFHNFYSYLPEAEDDAIRILRLLTHRQGVFLICATTLIDDYLFMATTEEASLIGPLKAGIEDPEVLNFFNLADQDFSKKYSTADALPVHTPTILNHELCPVCATGLGEFHTFGCPVEVCPWCGGQLANCNCKFTKLNTDRIDRESQVEALHEKIIQKGRIPFILDQRPDYPRKVE